MPFPVTTCAICGEEFELKPNKPGFANRCPECSEPEAAETTGSATLDAGHPEINAARRKAIRDMLYPRET